MFARFRNIFSKSKPDAMTEEENEAVKENGEKTLQSQPENSELGDNVTKNNGNITVENIKDTKELSEKDTKSVLDVLEEKVNSNNAAEVETNSMSLLQNCNNNTKQLSDEVAKELLKDVNITTEHPKELKQSNECNITETSEKILENITEKVKDAEKRLENNKSLEITETEKLKVTTLPSNDTEKHVATTAALAREASSPKAETTPSAIDQPKAATEQHADESKCNEDVVSDTKSEDTENVAALKVDVTQEQTTDNAPTEVMATVKAQEAPKNTIADQTDIKDSAQPETKIGTLTNGTETSGAKNLARVGNEVSSESSEAFNLTTQVSTNGNNVVAGLENRNCDVNTPNTSTMSSQQPTATNHLANSNEIALNNSSVVVDDLVTEVSSPVSVGTQQSAEGDATADDQAESGTIVVKPTGDNDIACTAISNKLQEISEVAESLDATIRDVQNDTEVLETTSSAAEKKRENMRSNSSEDWHSRSTEDESFATASEGNFTPHSHSSSFQTASGRTSSYISSGKNSFDASEADDEAAATSSINMSFDSSEHSFRSAQQQHDIDDDNDDVLKAHINAHVSMQGDGTCMADVEELRSQSVTPTPDSTHYCSIPVESETELESAYIAESPPMEMLTELTPMTSVTPEVSTCTPHSPPAPPQTTNTHSSSSGNPKPNAAWRRSKYYENITKQTIKGFL